MRELPVRKKIRLQGYNYSQAGYYFVTICVKGKHKILARIVGGAHPGAPPAHPGAPQIELTETGRMVSEYINKIDSIYDAIYVDKYVVMPNHLHFIFVIKDNGAFGCANGTPGCASRTKTILAKTINALKSLTSRQFGETMWQRSYHDHIIRDEAEYRRIWRYIDENPARWAEDCYHTL